MSTKEFQTIQIQAIVQAPIEKVWSYWTEPQHIMKWNFASEDWHTTSAVNDLRTGGSFSSRMEAKDGSFGFDFGGVYTEVIPHVKIAYVLGDNRSVEILFEPVENGIKITEVFDAETENSLELQRNGWQAILNNFKKHTENN